MKTKPIASQSLTPSALGPAMVCAIGAADQLTIRFVDPPLRAHVRPARIAVAGYLPSEGDRVLAVASERDCYIIGVFHCANPLTLRADDDRTAQLRNGALELRDPDGQLLVRYREGSAEVSAPDGDLALTAPRGRLVLNSASDVDITAGGRINQKAAEKFAVNVGDGCSQLSVERQRTELSTTQLSLQAKNAQVVAGQASVVAHHLRTTAKTLAQTVERYELRADQLIERTRDAFRDVVDLLQTRVGRARTIVKDVYTMRSRRTVMASKQDTRIDGSRILLG